MNLYGKIYLADIPKHLILIDDNGRKYIKVDIRQRRQPSQWGYTHYIKVDASSVDPGNQQFYIGDLKPSKWQPEQQQAQNASMPGDKATEYMVASTKSAPAQPAHAPATRGVPQRRPAQTDQPTPPPAAPEINFNKPQDDGLPF